MNLDNYIKSLNLSKVDKFIKNQQSNISGKKVIDIKKSDTSWIDMVEECIPYLDNIIRNPRRFIVQEENIVPIEKAKVVTEESIRHLAQNTNLIQEVNEDGTVIPLKLLNVYREETIDLYENRFIKSLVDNLYMFVNNKLSESDQLSYAKVDTEVSYNGVLKSKDETINITINLESKKDTEMNASKDGHTLEERIEHIRDIIGVFRSSTFIKGLKESSPVRSPIRKTNVILKEPNFIKALELWEYLEKNAIAPITEEDKREETIDSNSVKEVYDLAFYMANDIVSNEEVKEPKKETDDFKSILLNYILENDIKENEFKKDLTKIFKDAKSKKAKMVKEINKNIDTFIANYEKRKNKAYSILK